MKNCRICLIIRYFVLSVIFLIIISVTLTDDLHYLSFITPWNAVRLIFLLGFFVFIVKLIEYKKSKD
tara:strand:+ start:123 stop:323 length:201 start_codon:yes stop_codon:yes gene_type:complete